MKSVEKFLYRQFKLNPDTIPVRGIQRSTLCDMGRYEYHLIPNAMYKILTFNGNSTIANIINKYSEGSKDVEEIIKEYFQFLIDTELIFFTENSENYKTIELDWDYPAFITNAIIDLGQSSEIDFRNIFSQLTDLGCTHLQLRFFKNESNFEVKEIINHLKDTRIISIEMILPFQETKDLENWNNLIDTFSRIKYFQFYNAPVYKVLRESTYNGMGHIVWVENNILDENCCGVIFPHYFTTNIFVFAEAQKHNTCLNRKIAIDAEGNIKNCPSMKESYGNIKDTTLREALSKPGFKKYWNINKDQIEVCKDCEFRYICTDCRAYLEDPENSYSKPLKCGYNPYTCEWEEWSTNPLKQKAIEYYGWRNWRSPKVMPRQAP